MGSDWRVTTLADLCILANGKAVPKSGYADNGDTVVWGSNGPIGRVNEVMFGTDVAVIGRVGAYCGSVHRAPGPSWVTDNAISATARDQVSQEFIYYLLKYLPLKNQSSGSAQPLVTQNALKTIQCPAVPLVEQKRIAAVLGALDDKIELNRRINRTLEAMARAIFKSWFIDFDGHDPKDIVDSELGPIPKGWKVEPISTAMSVQDGRTIGPGERDGGPVDVFGANGVIGRTSKQSIFPACSVLGKIGSCGSLHRAWQPCWISNNGFGVLPSLLVGREMVWHTLLTIDFHQYVGGSANPYMPLKNFGHHRVLVPPEEAQARFEAVAGRIALRSEANQRQSDTLSTIRDTLLPRLISGEIRVPEAEDAVAEAI